MTREQLIALASEAGFATHASLLDHPSMKEQADAFFDKLERFAEIIEEKTVLNRQL